MRASGLFFLRMRAFIAMSREGERAVVLPVVERLKDPAGQWVSLNEMEAVWRGAAALTFFERHQSDLRPGRGLQLEIDRLAGHDGAWRGYVTSCALAPLPPSWTRHSPASTSDQPSRAMPA